MFLAADEEGDTVARISGSGKFDVPYIGDMRDLGRTGDLNAAFSTGATIGAYLSRLGFNVDFAPVADVLSNEENTIVQVRSFGTNPQIVAPMALALSAGLESENVLPVYKHFRVMAPRQEIPIMGMLTRTKRWNSFGNASCFHFRNV